VKPVWWDMCFRISTVLVRLSLWAGKDAGAVVRLVDLQQSIGMLSTSCSIRKELVSVICKDFSHSIHGFAVVEDTSVL
jgi:hypothetical protein